MVVNDSTYLKYQVTNMNSHFFRFDAGSRHFKYGTAVEHACQIFAEFARPNILCQAAEEHSTFYVASRGKKESEALTLLSE